MWYPAKQVGDAPEEPVTVAEVKAQSRIDFDDDDDGVIPELIARARDHIEKYCNIRIMPQTIAAKCDGFNDFSYLPFGPVQSITTISYVDPDGADQTLDASVYELRADDLDASIVLQFGKAWPARRAGSRITVTVSVGFEKLPPSIKGAALLYIAVQYENRDAQEMLTFSTADALLSNYRHGA